MKEILLAFLYSFMPLPDQVDYSKEFYLQNIECSLLAQEEMPWGKTVPEREFKHFVLPVRVNNENLDNSRIVFYKELKDRVKNLSMSEAILEVNHWCHEKVTYTPSDERTSSPLATVKTAYGRCGEESTFLVAALRAVGIPARQVYTPRWAHTDDNHAWVEAWADGKWHFLGACEPEAVLDLGWFNAPASRGMLMHTKAFGNYDGPEEVMQRTPCFTEIDVTSNYAPTAKTYVKVVDTKGKPVEDASVEFKIYNYAEFFTVSTKKTNNEGLTYMQAGLGDLISWAYKDGNYGFATCHFGKQDTVVVTLSHKSGERYTMDFTITPPKERNNTPYVSPQQKAINTARLIKEDSIRNAYVATFPQNGNDLIKASRGNYATIKKFIDLAKNKAEAEALLSVISAKDLRDVTIEVLNDHLLKSVHEKGVSDEMYYRYVLNPRVANEKLTCYKSDFENNLSFQFRSTLRNNPQAIINWTRDNIQIDNIHNPQHLRMTPLGVLQSKKTDATSRDIFFVALCRAMGVPARIDAVTGKTEYAGIDGKWNEVKFEELSAAETPKAQLKATFEKQSYIENPQYYSHFTLTKLEEGKPKLMNYAEDDTWASTFKDGATIDAGDYMLTSGTRMADGSVLVHLEVCNLKEGETQTIPLILPESKQGLQVIGHFNSEDIYADEKNGNKSLLSTTGRGYYVLGIIAPNNEPSNHTLRDIAACKKQLDEWGGTLVLLFRNQEEASRFNKKEFPALPEKTVFGCDIDGKIWNELAKEMKLADNLPPVFIIADTFNRIVYLSQGYTIGIGEQLSKALDSLKQK